MTAYKEEGYIYVLFGREAINLYKVSIEMLLSSSDLEYKVGAYNDVKAFMTEVKQWDGFIEISEQDYLTIKDRNSSSSRLINKSKSKAASFFKFFKS